MKAELCPWAKNGDGDLKAAAFAMGAEAYLLKANAVRELYLRSRLRWADEW